MASSNVTEAAMLDELFGPMSFGDFAERRDENNEDAEENEAPTNFLCSACGKESDALKMCNGCKCVWYCDKKCQNKHRKDHKKECKLIKKELDKRGGTRDVGTELDLGPVPELPPKEECPICMHALPMHPQLQTYSVCCGKIICLGCDYQHSKKNEVSRSCAFCRTPMTESSDEEYLVRLSKRVERRDRQAMCNMAVMYRYGDLGLPVDQVKCIDLLRQSAGLGLPDAQCKLGSFHCNGEMGLEHNEEEAVKYWEKAAEGGHVLARHNLGSVDNECVAAMRHWRLSASMGYRNSMEALIEDCFENGLLHHRDLAETLQAMYRARAEMKSADRDAYIEYLKRTGEYKKEYDC